MFICEICNKEFETKQAKNGHMQTHVKKNKMKKVVSSLTGKEVSISGLKMHEDAFLKRKKLEEEYSKNKKVCIGCGELHSFEKRNNQYCSKKCAMNIENKKRAKNLDYNSIVKKSKETKEKNPMSHEELSKRAKKGVKTKRLHGTICKQKNCTVFWNKCVICNKDFLYMYEKLTCSNECKRINQANVGTKNMKGKLGISGKYKGIRCDSSWEVAWLAYQFYIGNTPERCKSQLKYLYKNETKIYFPDFELNGKIYEIKGILTEKDKYKLKYNPQVILVEEKEILYMISKLKEWYKIKSVFELYDEKEDKKCVICNKKMSIHVKRKTCSDKCLIELKKELGHKRNWNDEEKKKIAKSVKKSHLFRKQNT